MSASPRSVHPLLAGFVLAAVTVAAYLMALRGGFLWDDDAHVTLNPTIIGPLGLKEIWTSASANYFPLVLTNFRAQHALWGLDPFGYHAVTVACHAIAAVLLWLLLRRLQVSGAWLGAALWALHPVQVESVAWICELKNTQSAVFFLLAALCFTRWLESRNSIPGSTGRLAYILSVACAVLALLSKPSTVMLPVVLVLIAWWRRARVDRSLLFAILPFLALSAVMSVWTIWEQKFHSGAVGPEWAQTWPERFAIAGNAVWFYLGKLAWPWPLSFIYPRWTIQAANPLAYLPLLLAVAGIGALAWGSTRHPTARAGFLIAAYFVALLFPVLGFFDVYFFRYSYVGDHFQYLASMGPLTLLGAALARLPRRTLTVAATATLAGLGMLTAWQSRDYHDNETLWRATLARNPAATMAWVNLGDALAKQHRLEEGLACFRRALTIKPGMADVHNDIGCTLVLAGRPAEAVPEFERALALQPEKAETYNNLGNALRALGRSDDAVVHFKRALALDANYAEAHNNLGAELAERGTPADALPHFAAALRVTPDKPDVHNNLGNALRQLGRLDEALAEHRKALQLKPDFAEAHASLGQALLAHGELGAALAELERALALKPDFSLAHGYLGRALALAGRPDDSLAHFQRAVALDPASAEARNNLGTALAQRGRMREAIAEFEAAVSAAPQFAPARVNLGMALSSARRWREAATQLQEAVRMQPNAADAQVQLAVVLVNMDRLEDSVPHFQQALSLRPGAADVHNNFAQVLQALGRAREAHEHFELAAKLRASAGAERR